MDDFSTKYWTSTFPSYSLPSADEIIKTCLDLQEELNEPPKIEVWIGEDDFFFQDKSEYPFIVLNNCLDDDEMYIVYGCGVVCGKRVYEAIWKQGYVAVWTDESPKK